MALSREEIAARYGTALFGYAEDVHNLDAIHAELNELAIALKENPKFVATLSDPILNRKDKEALLTSVERDLSEEVQNFLNMLLDYNRFDVVIEIIAFFNQLYNKAKGVASGTVTTSYQLSSDELSRLSDGYAKKYHLSSVRLENEVDPSIIGGAVLQVGDIVIDGSVKHRLTKIRRQLIDKK